MIPHKKNNTLTSLFTSFEDILDQRHPLFILANKIDWKVFEDAFLPLYSQDNGRPAKPIRLMVGLLILKHIRNISDESVVEQWSENNYYQYFCGECLFVPGIPCQPSELVHFRKRIGERGIELILKESIRVNGKDSDDDNVNIDTTVQEKNITFPTDGKLYKKMIKKCQKIAAQEGLPVRQTYTHTLKKLARDQRFRNHPKNKAKARKADKKIKTIAGRLVRELERNLPPNSICQDLLARFQQILAQTKDSKDKIYSIHEPDVCCISKGKEHKKYEFGNKASFAKTDTGVIVGAMGFRNEYDGHTLPAVIEQIQRMTNKIPKVAKVDRGYRGKIEIEGMKILIPGTPKKKESYYKRNKLSKAHKKRAGIEPVIGHINADHRLKLNNTINKKSNIFGN
ncbi:MAG TPA: IS5 family transposase [Saprospiraceae bacterium]|jgi:IS5 family transposase|nr:MAG: transposase IS4 family protein [Candidatus Parvibacillus calidus]MBX2936782.1 IS5 family transposase [Saprospiraceae bacterium]MCB0591982.1 IS5 family transposase [Saprospiraceae bacterium]MCC7148365.1 IS5 family transposase [Saprospiraceae bacterium]MCO6470209.1 IS5 family transposase [Saprospiraceae bacterium]